MPDFWIKFRKPLLALLALVFLFSSSVMQRRLNVKREDMGLTRTTVPDNMPPVLAFTTVALGSFRGLIANALWIRASDLQEQDKYFEMVQLSDWITKLQPHFVAVWVHQAWNMSYNISIKFKDPHDRWLWVLRGIELLRDEGLRYNPNEALLYRELAWHFQHKMGQNLDDAHHYYKLTWANEFGQVIGGGRPNFEELINPQTDEARERVRTLREKYKMNPQWMKDVDDRYGPLEWRLPETHAIYWAMVGLEKTDQRKLKQEELVQLRRVIFQSMQLAFHRGRVIYTSKDSRDFSYGPNLEIVGRASRSYEDMIEQEPERRQHLSTGHRNFLKTAVYFLYTYSRRREAQQWFDYLHEKYPDSLLTNQELEMKRKNPEYVPPKKDLDQYAFERVTEDVNETSVDRVKAIIEGMLMEAFTNLAIGENDAAVGLERYARMVWTRFMNEIGEESQKRLQMPAYAQIREVVLNSLLDPENGLEDALAAQLRTELNLPAPTPVPAAPPDDPAATNAPPPAGAPQK